MTIQTISVEMIDPNPYQPQTRIQLALEDLADLESIQTLGILQTPAVRPHPEQLGRYQMIFGWRRKCAWQLYRPGEPITVEVRQASDREMFEHGAIENGQRRDLGAIEKAQLMADYISQFGATQAQVGVLFGMGQAAVSNLIRLIKLPKATRELVDRGDVPERLARELVQFAQAGLGDVADKIAKEIAKADPDKKEQEAISETRDAKNKLLRLREWPTDWIAVEAKGIEHVKCGACQCCISDFYMLAGKRHCYYFCAHKKSACMDAKRAQWAQHELERISSESGIAILQPGENAPIIKFEGWVYEKARKMIASKKAPKCFRLRLKPDKFDGYQSSQHRQATDSDYVVLCSTEKDVLSKKTAEIKKETKASETPAERKKREAAEKRERAANRAERAAQRKAKADIAWLIFHVAELAADQVMASGQALTLFDDLNNKFTSRPMGGEWTEFFTQLDTLVGRIKKAQDGTKDNLLRQHIIIRRAASKVSAYTPQDQFDPARAIKKITEAIGEIGLALPAGWNDTPIHKTPTNCHVCGKFSSRYDRLTKIEIESGWRDDGGFVTCSDKCRKKGKVKK